MIQGEVIVAQYYKQSLITGIKKSLFTWNMFNYTPTLLSGGYYTPTLYEWGLYCNHLVRPSVCPSVHTFVTDISASTGRNDFIFDIWLWHGDLYLVSPFQVYRTSTSCLQCNLEFFMFAVMKTFVTVISASTRRNDYIWYMALAWWLVPCLPFPGLPHIYFLFTVRLTNERVGVFLARRSVQHLVRFSYLMVISTTKLCNIIQKQRGQHLFQVCIQVQIKILCISAPCYEVPPTRDYLSYYTPTHREGAILQSPCLSVRPSVHTFVTDISASTGRNDFIFDTWLWHSDLYLSPLSRFTAHLLPVYRAT